MPFQPGDRVFVDESKSRGYYITAAAAQPLDLADTNRAIRSLLKPGQRRIHFKSESNPRRRGLLAELGRLDLRTIVYQTKIGSDREGRRVCLTALIDDLVTDRASELFIEQDASLLAADRRLIRDQLARRSALGQLTYRHVAPADYPMLWVSDAVAWCQQAGGDWLRRAEPLVTVVVRL